MKKIICLLLIGMMCLVVNGCNDLRTTTFTVSKADKSTMTKLTAEDEYSIYYTNGWTSLSANKLLLSNGVSAFKMEGITKAPNFKARYSNKQLDFFYDKMTEYIKFVENTPSGGTIFESLGFDKSNAYLTGEYCVGIAPFKTSDGDVVVYSIVFDRKANLLAKFDCITKDETTYLAEVVGIREMLETLKMISETKERITVPDFGNIDSLNPNIWALFLVIL